MVFSHLDIWKTSFPHWKVSRSHLCSLFSDRPIINMEFPHCKRISSNSFAFLFFSIANVFYELCTRDCEDIEALLLYLEKEFNYSQYFLMGHSTGCQDIVYFLKNSELAKKVKISSCILQVWDSPSRSLHLSFREPWATENTWCKIQMYSFPLLSERIDSKVPWLHQGSRIEANRSASTRSRCSAHHRSQVFIPAKKWVRRYTSLAGRLTEDDLFSTDLTGIQWSVPIIS